MRYGRYPDINLREYEPPKFAIAKVLRHAVKSASSSGSEKQEQARNLFARLAEDRFNLVVVGRFSRGKTSLRIAYWTGKS
jgi:hypothetical protein